MGHAISSVFKGIANVATLGLLNKPAKATAAPLPTYTTAGGDTATGLPQDAATRSNLLTSQAAAAGAERTDNSADLLGAVKPKTKTSGAAASSLLG